MIRNGLVCPLLSVCALVLSHVVNFASAAPVHPYIINGTPVPAGQYTEVVQIKSETGDNCAATVVGPRTIITAAHCAKTSPTVTFSVKGTQYKATITKSTLYPSKNHDLALGLTSTDIAGITPASLTAAAPPVGNSVNILGFGCTAVDQASDNTLRIGQTVVQGLDQYQFHSGTASGALLCYGDSGGPVFLDQAGGGRVLVGVSAMGNITTTNYHVRLDIPESQQFMSTYVSTNNTKICGLNGYDCGIPPPPPPTDPSCTLVASPAQVAVGGTVTLSLTTSNAVSATINNQPANVPNDQKQITAGGPGQYSVQATATNSANVTKSCQATYLVQQNPPPPPPDQRPSCTITATPSEAWQGDLVTLDLQAIGTVDWASIDGTKVKVPLGRKIIKAATVGDRSVMGFVHNPSGPTQNCYAYYTVHSGVHPPPLPKFAVVSSYCGDNTVSGSKVKKVCWAVINTDASTKLRTPFAVLLKFSDNSPDETMLVASHAPMTAGGASSNQEKLALYANKTIPTNETVVFDTRPATLTKDGSKRQKGDTIVPVAIEGTSTNREKFSASLTAVETTPQDTTR